MFLIDQHFYKFILKSYSLLIDKIYNYGVQAVSPFIDPVTAKKIHFCDPGPKGDAVLASLFDMNNIEECMGGRAPPAFDSAKYERQQLEDEELRKIPGC
jgi:hypothetical protein